MKKLILNAQESKQLLETGGVEITRNGFTILVEINNDYNSEEEEFYGNLPYNIVIINDYNKVIVKGGKN